MIWHPQRLIETPEGFEDNPYVYPFNDTAFNITLAHGQEVVGLPIEMDEDADFYLCSIAFLWDNAPKWLGIKLRDGYGQYLSDDYLSIIGFGYAAGSTNAPLSSGGFTDVIEIPAYMKAGSVLLLDVKNQSSLVSMTFNQPFELRGFRRYPVGVCA